MRPLAPAGLGALCVLACLVALLSPALAQGPAQAPAQVPTPGRADGAALLAALRAGGHVLYVRHARADVGEDQEGADPGDCARQRTLSALGREQAVRLGETLRALRVPVGAVLASPLCRTLETARLAFGRAEPTTDLRGAGAAAEADRAGVVAALRARLASPPEEGTNTLLVAHGNNMRWLEGFQLGDAEAAVFRPEAGNHRLVGRVRLDEWAGLDR